MTAEATTVRGACPHDCPDTCAWRVDVQDGVAVRLYGEPDHPFTRGGLCAKVNHYLERVYSSERVLYPLRRVGPKGEGEFERISWNEALNEITRRFCDIIAEHGAEAILPYSYEGTQGLVQSHSLDRRFFARLGATRLERLICGDAANAGLVATQGSGWGVVPEDLRHSRFVVLWGTNTVVTNLHLWPFIREAQAGGATVVVIDPILTRTAQAADWHVRPLPGSDAALALGMMHVIVAEGLHDLEYVESFTVGFQELRVRLADYPPERVSRLTGLEEREIVRLARAYATSRPAAIRLQIGMEHHEHGAMTYRAIAALPALVGAWRDLGGGLSRSTHPYFFEALNMSGLEGRHLQQAGVRSVNMARLGDVLTNGVTHPAVRALFVYASNPAVIAPTSNLVRRGLAREDLFTVVHEQFLTDTARFADLVLPATTQVEHLDLMPPWGHLRLALNKPAIAPLGEAVPTTEVFRRLAQCLGFTEGELFDSDEELARTALDSSHPFLEGVTYERLEREGWVDLNLPQDWRPFAHGAFPTPSGKAEFFSATLAEQGFDPLPGYTAARESAAGDQDLAARYPLALISAKGATHFLNSNYANLPRHRRAEKEPLLDLSPKDASDRGIADGDQVRVWNDRGEVYVRAKVGHRVRQGVVALPFGWWGLSGVNALTNDALTDLGGGSAFHDTLVQVEYRDK